MTPEGTWNMLEHSQIFADWRFEHYKPYFADSLPRVGNLKTDHVDQFMGAFQFVSVKVSQPCLNTRSWLYTGMVPIYLDSTTTILLLVGVSFPGESIFFEADFIIQPWPSQGMATHRTIRRSVCWTWFFGGWLWGPSATCWKGGRLTMGISWQPGHELVLFQTLRRKSWTYVSH